MSIKEKRLIQISVVVNIIIFCLVILASTIMFTGFKFMHGYEPILESAKIEMMKFFTVDSNMFMGIVALILAIEELKLLKGKTKEISEQLYILKLMATTGVALTFFIVFTYLGPISVYGIVGMIQNSNLFLHLIIPVLSIICFVVFERTNKIPIRQTWKGIIPVIVYAIFYLVNVIIHMENGKVSPTYDWYWFVQNGVWTAIVVVPMIMGIAYLISLALWKINNKKD